MKNDELSNIDFLSLILACWGIDLSYKNLKLNLGQEDKDDIMQKLDKQTAELLSNIHKELEKQNKMLEEQTEILKKLAERMI